MPGQQIYLIPTALQHGLKMQLSEVSKIYFLSSWNIESQQKSFDLGHINEKIKLECKLGS